MLCGSNNCKSNIMPETSQYFKEELFCEILSLPPNKPPVEKVLDILVWPEISDVRLIDTPIGISNEGQNLTGRKLVIEVKLNQKLTYVADDMNQGVHAAHYEILKSVFVVIPNDDNLVGPCDLVNLEKLNITPFVEGMSFRALDCRNVYEYILLFVDVKLC